MPCCIVILVAAFKSDFTCHPWEFHLHYLNLWKGATLMAFEECSWALTHSLTWRLFMNHSFGICAVMFTESTSCLVPYASPRFFTLRLIFLESWNKSRQRGAQPKESDSALLRASHLVSVTITNFLSHYMFCTYLYHCGILNSKLKCSIPASHTYKQPVICLDNGALYE